MLKSTSWCLQRRRRRTRTSSSGSSCDILTYVNGLLQLFSVSLTVVAICCGGRLTCLQWRREGGRGRAAAPGETLQWRRLRYRNLDFGFCISICQRMFIFIFNLFSALRMGVAGWRGRHHGPLPRAEKNPRAATACLSVSIDAVLTGYAGGRHTMPPPLWLDHWPFDLESGFRVSCDVVYLCANFGLPRPLCSRLRPDVRDRQTSDGRCQTRIMLNASAQGGGGGGIIIQ